MKKILFFSLAMLLILTSVTGCMGNDKEDMSSMMSSVMSEMMPDMSSSNNESSTKNETTDASLGEYDVKIVGYRLAKDYEDKDIVIVKYNFKNNSDNSASFTFAISDKVYQKGIGLNKCYTVADSANYSSANQSKDIKKGASIDVEVAYNLNDNSTPIEVECSELISFSDNKIRKSFNIKSNRAKD